MNAFRSSTARVAIALVVVILIAPVLAPSGASAARIAQASLQPPAAVQAAVRARIVALSQQARSRSSQVAATSKPSTHNRHTYAGFDKIADQGFGDTQNGYAWTMAWFNGRLYVGTSRNNLCNASIIKKSAWTRRVTGCPDPSQYFSLDMRAEIWAFTPGPNTWQLVYRSPMVNQDYNGSIIRLARDAGYRTMTIYTDKNGVTGLYVGTTGFGDLAYLLRTVDGTHFDTVGSAGLGVKANSIRALTPFAGKLFVAPIGSGTNYFAGANRDKVFYTDDPAGGKWTAASYTGFGDQNNGQLYSMAAFDGQLYAGISNTSGYQVWRTYATGKAPFRWYPVLLNGAYRGSPSPTVTTMAVFNNKLYIGSAAETISSGGTLAKASEIVALNPDDSWNLVMGDARQTPEGYKSPLSGYGAGFNNSYNAYLWKIASHDGWLYAGTYDFSTFDLVQSVAARRAAGFDLWRSHDGAHWEKVSTSGFDNPYNYGVRTMEDTPYGLFLGTANPFAQAPDHLGGAEIWLLPTPDGLKYPHAVSLSSSPCPMAHCAAALDNQQNLTIPTQKAAQTWQFNQKGVIFSTALGCSTGAHIVVCAGTKIPLNSFADNGYVYALDFKGNLLWDSRRLLNGFAGGGVPLIDSQDNSYVSDNNSIISFSPQGVVRWQIQNPANAVLVSLNMLSSGYLVGQAGLSQSGQGLLMVINPQTGEVVNTLDLKDSVNGAPGEWGTANTISVVGNRLYTVTQFVGSGQNNTAMQRYGRLYAIDVDASGQLKVAWFFSFQGPSGASPLAIAGPQTTIYFDGTGASGANQTDVTLFALRDNGGSPMLLWARDMTKDFGIPYSTSAPAAGIQATPSRDPRGGIWVWSEFDHRVFRFDEATGQSDESFSIASLTNDPAADPTGASTIIPNNGKPVMVIGVLAGPQHFNSVAAIDLTSHKLLWSNPVGIGVDAAPYGQFPLAATSSGPLLIAPVSDGNVHAYTLS